MKDRLLKITIIIRIPAPPMQPDEQEQADGQDSTA